MKKVAANVTLAASVNAEWLLAREPHTLHTPHNCYFSMVRWSRLHSVCIAVSVYTVYLAARATNSKIMSTSFSASIRPATDGGSKPKSVI